MFIFDGAAKRIYIEPNAVGGNVVQFTTMELWSRWLDWHEQGDNSKYEPAFESIMVDIGGGQYAGQFLFIRNDLGWRGVPPEADGITIVINGSFFAKSEMLPVMENIPNQETDLVINRSAIATTIATSGGTTDLSTVIAKLNQIQSSLNNTATKGDVWGAKFA